MALTTTLWKFIRSRYDFKGTILVGLGLIAHVPDPEGLAQNVVDCDNNVGSLAIFLILSKRSFSWSRYLRIVAIKTFDGRFSVPSTFLAQQLNFKQKFHSN